MNSHENRLQLLVQHWQQKIQIRDRECSAWSNPVYAPGMGGCRGIRGNCLFETFFNLWNKVIDDWIGSACSTHLLDHCIDKSIEYTNNEHGSERINQQQALRTMEIEKRDVWQLKLRVLTLLLFFMIIWKFATVRMGVKFADALPDLKVIQPLKKHKMFQLKVCIF